MKTFYLVDFENVHNKGLENIAALKSTEQVHIFSTKNAMNIRKDIVFAKDIDVKEHIVPIRSQSLDMHLVSYLGHLLGVYGKQCSYIIVSKDTDYDNIINFWKKEGWSNISRRTKILETAQKKITPNFSGNDKCGLNVFMQRKLVGMRYTSNVAQIICKCAIAHCNDKQMLVEIHNELKNEFTDYRDVYKDVKDIFEEFMISTGIDTKKQHR